MSAQRMSESWRGARSAGAWPHLGWRAALATQITFGMLEPIYACAADRCDLCRPLDNQSEHWDGTTPVDGGDTDA